MSELLLYYAIADVFVLPSDVGETWGIVVNEAMCFDLPVVVSDVVGCGLDLVKDKGTGSIFPLGNIEKLASSIKDAVLNPQAKRSLDVIKQYSYEKDVEGIISATKEKCHVSR
jgi:glycosyltransferase involved in cell wall biosynthesis